jgi:hypothetical protein
MSWEYPEVSSHHVFLARQFDDVVCLIGLILQRQHPVVAYGPPPPELFSAEGRVVDALEGLEVALTLLRSHRDTSVAYLECFVGQWWRYYHYWEDCSARTDAEHIRYGREAAGTMVNNLWPKIVAQTEKMEKAVFLLGWVEKMKGRAGGGWYGGDYGQDGEVEDENYASDEDGSVSSEHGEEVGEERGRRLRRHDAGVDDELIRAE